MLTKFFCKHQTNAFFVFFVLILSKCNFCTFDCTFGTFVNALFLRHDMSIFFTVAFDIFLLAFKQQFQLLVKVTHNITALNDTEFVVFWNIAERLGSTKDYTGCVRANFIKRMFPDEMTDIELDSIQSYANAGA